MIGAVVRELLGWLLVVVGLLMFGVVFLFCNEHWIIEAGVMTPGAIFVFRGGIQLLKTATAARICAQAQDRLYPARPPAAPARR